MLASHRTVMLLLEGRSNALAHMACVKRKQNSSDTELLLFKLQLNNILKSRNVLLDFGAVDVSEEGL